MMSMTTTHPTATARESARQRDGKFGEQHRDEAAGFRLELPVVRTDPAAAQQMSEALDSISHDGEWDIDSESQRLIEAFGSNPTAENWREARSVMVDRTITLWGAVNLLGRQVAAAEVPEPAQVADALQSVAGDHTYLAQVRAESDFEPAVQLADGCTCGKCGPGCAAALARACCGACTGPEERCSCATHGDGTRTTMMCPTHADADPCATVAQVTGKRRRGTLRSGRCTNCGWQG
jgi:hypothetical protein